MNKFKICVYAICKNEEKFVSRWVESMKEADKIFVLDTGSTGPVTEAGQLELTLNGAPIDYTVVGRATGTSDITGLFLITTTTENSVLTVRNPAGNPAALTITPLAGGTNPVSAHLVITQIS